MSACTPLAPPLLRLCLPGARRSQEDELQHARARHAKSREKNATLKDNNRILTEQAQRLQDECEAAEAQARRREHQLRGEMALVAQVRIAIRRMWQTAAVGGLELRGSAGRCSAAVHHCKHGAKLWAALRLTRGSAVAQLPLSA